MSGSRSGKLIVLGAAAGVGLALLLRKPHAETHAAAEPAAANSAVTTTASVVAPPPAIDAAAPVATTAPAAPSATAPSTSSASSNSAQAPSVPPPPEVADLAELKTAEIRCYQQDPDACYRAAAAYASGKLLPADPARAANYRKVEQTQLFRQCEKAQVRSCLVLAERYANGDGLPVDAQKSQKLLKHVRELCPRRPAAECALVGLPAK